MKFLVIDGVRYQLLYHRKQILAKVAELAQSIALDFADTDDLPILMFVLTGGLYFGIDLSRQLSEFGLEHAVDTVGLKRYTEDEKAGEVRMISLPHANLGNRRIIVVEDIIDQGLTMNFLHSYLLNLEVPPQSIDYCTLFLKTNHEPLDFDVKYLGWKIGPEWVVGNGMDSDQQFRGLEDVYVKSPN